MTINKPKEKSEGVRVIVLTTGQIIIGEVFVQPNNEYSVFVRNVAQLYEMPPQEKGQQPGLAMVPFLPFSKAVEQTEVVSNNIVTMSEPVPELNEQYSKQFGKVIQPKPELIKPTQV